MYLNTINPNNENCLVFIYLNINIKLEINVDLKAKNKTSKALKFIIKSYYKLLIFYLK